MQKKRGLNLKGLFLRFSPHFQFPLLPLCCHNFLLKSSFLERRHESTVHVVRLYNLPAPGDLYSCLTSATRPASGVPTSFSLFTPITLGPPVPSSYLHSSLRGTCSRPCQANTRDQPPAPPRILFAGDRTVNRDTHHRGHVEAAPNLKKTPYPVASEYAADSKLERETCPQTVLRDGGYTAPRFEQRPRNAEGLPRHSRSAYFTTNGV